MGDCPRDDDGLWVRSEVMPNGSYGVAINVGADRAWTLTPERAVAHAVACFARATEAEHDAAVFRLLTSVQGVTERDAAQLIARELRPDRPDQHNDTAPLRFTIAISRSRSTKGMVVPLLHLHLEGRGKDDEVGQLTPDDLREHAAGVLNAMHGANLDAAFHRLLIGTVGVPDGTARAMVGALAHHGTRGDGPRREDDLS